MSLGKGVGVKVEIIVTGDELNELNKNCVIHIPKPMTNEEWFCQLPTEEKAKVLADEKLQFRMLNDGFIKWLKEKHKE